MIVLEPILLIIVGGIVGIITAIILNRAANKLLRFIQLYLPPQMNASTSLGT